MNFFISTEQSQFYLCAQIFDLGFAKNDVGIGSGALVNIWVADDKEDRLVFPKNWYKFLSKEKKDLIKKVEPEIK